ncbi:MAG: PilZ domain-containing protein [Spirochaetales bacterium]|nr:PilZ domain-containing protein [Spirochaetales bacterium]MCF7937557.1 PilZ domain-containing protein [Spirochaetales bacterium]
MASFTTQKINNLYASYKQIEVTFNREVIKNTGLQTRHILLKCLGEAWPCVIYSSSMSGAKILINAKAKLIEKIKKSNNLVSLHYKFLPNPDEEPIIFFVAARVAGLSPYGEAEQNNFFLTLTFTQRPPDDLIEILGILLEATANAKQRKEERILINNDTQRSLGLKSKEAYCEIQGVPRKCIIRDLSFSGAKVIIMGVAKFLIDKEAKLKLFLEETSEPLVLTGKVLRFEEVEGRKELAAIALQFHEEQVPMQYKIRLSSFLGTRLSKQQSSSTGE